MPSGLPGEVDANASNAFAIGAGAKPWLIRPSPLVKSMTGGPNSAAIGFRSIANGNSAVAIGKDAEAAGHRYGAWD